MPNVETRVFAALVVLAVWPSGRPAVAQAIADNSFLVEEAYNQEQGVVQHIGTWIRALDRAPWVFTFTQEWPLGSQTHQLSYSIPFQQTPARLSGFGDAAINYRYQWLAADAPVAFAPRVSMLIPTGSEARGLGSGALGAQLNLPLSATLGSSVVTHWNAGVTAIPDVTTYNLGGSVIWLATPVFNILCEAVWLEQNTGARSVILNPGVRWAHNFASGLQIVPGVAYGIGLGPSQGERTAFFYLSFEHRFKAESGRD
ncbi:MAG TPA: hypothetical protein VFO67_13740 [Gemmatimonadales bacterium]|nr:hypothetical protein [Gemmatimonadales bacterium]